MHFWCHLLYDYGENCTSQKSPLEVTTTTWRGLLILPNTQKYHFMPFVVHTFNNNKFVRLWNNSFISVMRSVHHRQKTIFIIVTKRNSALLINKPFILEFRGLLCVSQLFIKFKAFQKQRTRIHFLELDFQKNLI